MEENRGRKNRNRGANYLFLNYISYNYSVEVLIDGKFSHKKGQKKPLLTFRFYKC